MIGAQSCQPPNSVRSVNSIPDYGALRCDRRLEGSRSLKLASRVLVAGGSPAYRAKPSSSGFMHVGYLEARGDRPITPGGPDRPASEEHFWAVLLMPLTSPLPSW